MSLNNRAVSAMRARRQRSALRAERKRLAQWSPATGVELEAWRTGLGLTHDEMAHVLGVSLRMWHNYAARACRMPIRHEIRFRAYATYIANLETRYWRAIEAAGEQEVVLCWYRSGAEYGGDIGNFAAYRTAIGRLVARAPGLRLAEFDPKDFQRWLRGREDSESHRAMWAAARFEDAPAEKARNPQYLQKKVDAHLRSLMSADRASQLNERAT